MPKQKRSKQKNVFRYMFMGLLFTVATAIAVAVPLAMSAEGHKNDDKDSKELINEPIVQTIYDAE